MSGVYVWCISETLASLRDDSINTMRRKDDIIEELEHQLLSSSMGSGSSGGSVGTPVVVAQNCRTISSVGEEQRDLEVGSLVLSNIGGVEIEGVEAGESNGGVTRGLCEGGSGQSLPWDGEEEEIAVRRRSVVEEEVVRALHGPDVHVLGSRGSRDGADRDGSGNLEQMLIVKDLEIARLEQDIGMKCSESARHEEEIKILTQQHVDTEQQLSEALSRNESLAEQLGTKNEDTARIALELEFLRQERADAEQQHMTTEHQIAEEAWQQTQILAQQLGAKNEEISCLQQQVVEQQKQGADVERLHAETQQHNLILSNELKQLQLQFEDEKQQQQQKLQVKQSSYENDLLQLQEQHASTLQQLQEARTTVNYLLSHQLAAARTAATNGNSMQREHSNTSVSGCPDEHVGAALEPTGRGICVCACVNVYGIERLCILVCVRTHTNRHIHIGIHLSYEPIMTHTCHPAHIQTLTSVYAYAHVLCCLFHRCRARLDASRVPVASHEQYLAAV